MSSEAYVLLVVTAIGVRLVFYMMRSRQRQEAQERIRELEDRPEDAGRHDSRLDDIIRENDAVPRAPRKRDRVRNVGPVVDEVKRRCERCDMRVSGDRKLCSACERVVKRTDAIR